MENNTEPELKENINAPEVIIDENLGYTKENDTLKKGSSTVSGIMKTRPNGGLWLNWIYFNAPDSTTNAVSGEKIGGSGRMYEIICSSNTAPYDTGEGTIKLLQPEPGAFLYLDISGSFSYTLHLDPDGATLAGSTDPYTINLVGELGSQIYWMFATSRTEWQIVGFS